MRKLGWVFATLMCWIACGDDESPSKPRPDAGERRDASSGGSRDASLSEGRDASPAADSGERDARVSEPDAGMPPVDDGPGETVTIEFRAEVRDEAFDCGRKYTIPGLGYVEPREFKFYVQDLALIDAAGKEVPVRMLQRWPSQMREVALLDFENATGSCQSNATVNTRIIGKVPEGSGKFSGVVFTNGVPVELNHDDPTTFPPPLQDFSMYWNWFQGFKFFVADLGSAGTPPEGEEDAGIAPAQSVLHVGSGACSPTPDMETQCERPYRNRIRLMNFDPAKNVIVADIAAVFADTPAKDTFCHGVRSTCRNVYRNVGLELDTGKPSDGQKVFRVE